MTKPPANDQQLEQRVAQLEQKVASLEPRVAATEASVAELDGRVTALEEGEPEPPIEPPVEPPTEPPPAGTLAVTIALPDRPPAMFREAEAADIGSYADPAGRFTMTNRRQIRPDCPIRVDFRRIDGWAAIVFAYGDILDPSNANLPPHRVTITNDAGTETTIDLPGHWKFARWRWQSSEWPIPITTVDELYERKLLPRFDASVGQGRTGEQWPPQVYAPMGMAGIMPYMPTTGGRADIGPVTDWQADYLCNGTPTGLANVLAQGEAGNTTPWHWQDAQGNPIDPTKQTGASTYKGNPNIIPGDPQVSGIELDTSHMPALGYLPFVLTGDPYYLEVLQQQACAAPMTRPGGMSKSPMLPDFDEQTRAIAWNARNMWQAYHATPEQTPGWLLPKASLRKMFDGLLLLFDTTMKSPEPQQTFRAWTPQSFNPGWNTYATWQEDYIQSAVAWGSMLLPELLPFAKWHIQNLIARVNPDNTSGWCGGMPEIYYLQTGDTKEGPFYRTWAETWPPNKQLLGLDHDPTLTEYFGGLGSYDYANGLQAALSTAVQAGIAEARPALDVLAPALEAGLRANAGWKEWKYCIARP